MSVTEAMLVCWRQENASLREQTEELQAQLLHRHVEEGRQLLLSTKGSLAAELENVSLDEVGFSICVFHKRWHVGFILLVPVGIYNT